MEVIEGQLNMQPVLMTRHSKHTLAAYPDFLSSAIGNVAMIRSP